MARKYLGLLLVFTVVIGLVGCGGTTTSTTTSAASTETSAAQGTTSTTTTGGATTVAEKVYKTYLDADCSSVNFLDNVDSNTETPATYTASGLWRTYPNEDGSNYIFLPDLAEGEPEQVDANNWIIHLRKGATFHNGDPINADTWIFTFQQQLNPKLAQRMATFLYDNAITIVNGENYLKQGLEGYPATVTWEEVGIKKIDEYTIQLTTVEENTATEVMRHFLNRNLTPINEEAWNKALSADGLTTSYGSDLANYVGSGPYYFTDWQFDSLHVYTKNPDHWLADYFNYDRVEVRIVPEMNARVALFEKGDILSLTPDANTIDAYLDDPRMTTYGSLRVTHIDINALNPDNPLSGNVNYRKALYHAIDRVTVADTIFGHMTPVGTYVNNEAGMFSESGLTYRESEPGKAVTALVESWGPAGYNPELALEYMNKAFEEEGLSADTVVTIKYAIDESEKDWKALGEYLMEEWQTIFQGKIKLEIVAYAGMSATDFKKTGDDKWDLSPNNWQRGMSRTYPHTCFYYYTTKYPSGPNNFYPEAFEAQYDVCEAARSGDYATLLAETGKLEEIYLEYVVHIPIYQRVNYDLFSETLILPVDHYIPGFGWGISYGDIKTD